MPLAWLLRTCASLEMVAVTAAHIPSDCRLSDIEAELEQLTMNVGRPERVRRLISPMSVRSSAETFGLPTGLRDRQLQYARNPARASE